MAILKAKSLTRSIDVDCHGSRGRLCPCSSRSGSRVLAPHASAESAPPRTSACPTHRSGSARRTGRSARTRSRPSPSRGRSASARSTRRAAAPVQRGAISRPADLGSSPFRVAIVRQSIGQMSMHASHSMHSESVKCVSMSQFRQRSTSIGLLRREAQLRPRWSSSEALRQLDVRHLLTRCDGS